LLRDKKLIDVLTYLTNFFIKCLRSILLATTAVFLTAGAASAEVTFSGRGEAGVYRLAPKAAVTAVTGVDVVDSSAAGTDVTATDVLAVVNYNDAGVLTTTLSTAGGTVATPATAAMITTKKGAIAVEIAAAVADEVLAAADLAAAEVHYKAGNAVDDGDDDLAASIVHADDATAHRAQVARLQAELALLEGTAGVAAGATPDTKAYSGYDLDVKVSGASDNGMTFSMGFDIGAGQIADSTDDLAMDDMGTTFAAEELVIGYNGYTVKIGDNLIDDLYDDSQNGDVSVSGTIGELSFGIVTDMDKDTAKVDASTVYTVVTATTDRDGQDTLVTTAAVAAVWETTSYSLGYKAGDVAFSLVGTDGNDAGEAAMKVSASAPLGDFKFTASIDNKGKADDIAKLAVSYTTGGMTLTASSADDANHSLNTNKDKKASYDVGLSYAMGAATVQYNTDESAAWWANASYNLGGGAAAFATIDHTDFAVAGVKFTF
jgi:hypothetical protein